MEKAAERWMKDAGISPDDLGPAGSGLMVLCCECPAYVQELDPEADSFELFFDEIRNEPAINSVYDE